MPSHNTGTLGTLSSVGHATAFTFTVPAGVATGDVMIAGINCFSFPQTTPSVTTPTSGGGSWTQIGSMQVTQDGTAGVFGTAWFRVATASDPGSTFTMSYNGTVGTDTFWWCGTLDSYTGFYTADPIAQGQGTTGTAQTAIGNCPVLSTKRPGSWAVYLGPITPSGGGALTGVPSGTTQRQLGGSGGIDGAASDSNGSVGAVGTSIGGGAFTSVSATDNWWTEFTIELATVAGGSAGGTAPPRIPHPRFLDILLETGWQRADRPAQGFTDLAVSFASSAGGIDTYNTLSSYNGASAQQMRVLAPTAPNASYPHAFLIMLPVEAAQGTTFGDPLAIAQGLGAHNAYNLTCIEPGYPVDPWYADNPGDISIYEETFTLKLTAWIKANLATAGRERVYLAGFSKSGLGAQGLLFRHPDVFAAAASWDAPFAMTDYDGTDPTHGSQVGGGPAVVYGTSWNFQTRYALSAGNLARWKATGQFGINRVWIGGFSVFQTDVAAYDSALTTAGIPHTDTYSVSESHLWAADWVSAALAAVIPSNYAEAPTALPQQIPHPLYLRLLGVAEFRATGGPRPATAAAAAAGVAAAAGTAPAPAAQVTAAPAAAASAGQAPAPATAITANAAAAASTGTAPAPQAAVTVNAGVAASAAVALQPSVSTSGNTNAPAAVATATGAALQPATAITVTAGVAVSSATAPQPAAAVTVTAGAAVSGAVANAATVTTIGSGTANPPAAAAGATAPPPAVQVTATAGVATAASTAPAATRPVFAAIAAAGGTATAPSITALANAQAAAVLATAPSATGQGVTPAVFGTALATGTALTAATPGGTANATSTAGGQP